MRFDNVYIISYLPDDPDLRASRLEKHRVQLAYWMPKAQVIVYAQNYKDKSDFTDGVTYLINEGALKRPGPARNECLKHFYGSFDDFTVIMDDDIVLYSGEKYMDSDDLLDKLRKIDISEFNRIDIFEPLNPTQSPFTKMYQDEASIFAESFWFKAKAAISGQSVFIKNLSKHKPDKVVYYQDLHDENGNIIMGEDVLFGLDAIKKGLCCFTLMNAVRKDMGWSLSTWATDEEKRKKAFSQLKDILIEYGIPQKGDNMDWSKFLAQHHHPKAVFVNKEETLW